MISVDQDFKLTYMKNILKLKSERNRECVLCMSKEYLCQAITFKINLEYELKPK